MIVKQMFAGLTSILLEACKRDMSEREVRHLLNDECTPSVTGSVANVIVKVYNEKKVAIRERLSLWPGVLVPHIVDMKWRLDYHIKSSTLEKIRAPMYFLAFHLDNGTTVDFTCNHEELQDLLLRVQDAKKQVERILN